MKHTEKTILVPADITERSKPIDAVFNSLNNEMEKILKSKNIPSEIKLVKYNQVLQTFSRLQEKRRQPYELNIVENTGEGVSDDEILADIPKTHLQVAERFLNDMRKNPNIEIESNGELVINGQKIYGSNVVDLVHQFSRDQRISGLPGTKELSVILDRSNIPLKNVGNKKLRHSFATARTDANFNWDESL